MGIARWGLLLTSLPIAACLQEAHTTEGAPPAGSPLTAAVRPTAKVESGSSNAASINADPAASEPVAAGGRSSPNGFRLPLEADPAADRFNSQSRANRLAQALETCERMSRPTLDLRLALARELLAAGQPTDAIAILEQAEALFNLRTEQPHGTFRLELCRLLACAWMRIGELDNCVLHHGSTSCIVPLARSAQHTEPRGSQQALIQLKSILDVSSMDFEARWLYNIAAMTVGEWPDRVPSDILIPPSCFASEQPFPVFNDIAAVSGIAFHGHAGGACLDDFDDDGSLDLVESDWSNDGPLHYFKGASAHHFEDRTKEAGVDQIHGGLALSHADFDNDADLDVLVLRGAWKTPIGAIDQMTMLSNDGQGVFADVTNEVGLQKYVATQTAAIADFDLDGCLDIFVGNESAGRTKLPSYLFRSDRQGRYVDVAPDMELNFDACVKGSAWGDYDNDGDPDLLIARLDGLPLLLRNDGQRFTSVAESAGVAAPFGSLVCWWFDYDNDGWLDLFLSAFAYEETADLCRDYLGISRSGIVPRIYNNRHNGALSDVTRDVGMWHVLPALSGNVGDFDNDGWTDFYLGTGEPDLMALYPNRLFRNSCGVRFSDVTTAAGVGHIQKCSAVVTGDVDGDGDQDIFAHLGGFYPGDTFPGALFENSGNANAWVTLLLQGTQANRSAIGARVRVRVREPDGTSRDIHHLVGTGGSAGSQSLQAEIGLGDATVIEEVEVRWPGGLSPQLFHDVAMRRSWRLVEGQSAPVALERSGAEAGGR